MLPSEEQFTLLGHVRQFGAEFQAAEAAPEAAAAEAAAAEAETFVAWRRTSLF